MLWLADGLAGKARAAMKDFALHTTLSEIWAVVAEANRYFASQEPWVLRKSDPARMNTVLYVTAEVLRAVGILAQPFVPTAAAKLLDLLAIAPEDRVLAAVGHDHRLAPGGALPQPAPIFPRYVEAEAS
jgi:methionyl-tRNA synthetase